MGWITHDFTGTPAECDEHFEACCAQRHPAGYGTKIIRTVGKPVDLRAIEAKVRHVRNSLGLGGAIAKRNRIAQLDSILGALAEEITITIGGYDTCD